MLTIVFVDLKLAYLRARGIDADPITPNDLPSNLVLEFSASSSPADQGHS